MMRCMLALLLCGFAFGAGAEEPLQPEQAFRFSASAIDAQTIEATWKIAPGYYMYRDKFKFTAEPAKAILGKIETPPGNVKDDETFGKVETYRDEVRIRIAVISTPGPLILKAVSQGCADLGICYPPLPQTAQLDMPVVSAAMQQSSEWEW